MNFEEEYFFVYEECNWCYTVMEGTSRLLSEPEGDTTTAHCVCTATSLPQSTYTFTEAQPYWTPSKDYHFRVRACLFETYLCVKFKLSREEISYRGRVIMLSLGKHWPSACR